MNFLQKYLVLSEEYKEITLIRNICRRLMLLSLCCVLLLCCAGMYHCWLQMDTTLMIGQYVPIVVLAVLTLTLIEAAGAAEYRKLPGIDQRQQTSAKIMQRSNLIIMPMVFARYNKY